MRGRLLLSLDALTVAPAPALASVAPVRRPLPASIVRARWRSHLCSPLLVNAPATPVLGYAAR